PALLRILDAEQKVRTGYYLALLERAFACDAHLSTPTGYGCSSFFDYGPAALAMAPLYDRGMGTDAVIRPTVDWHSCYRLNCYAMPVLERAISAVEHTYRGKPLPEELRQRLIGFRGQLSDDKDIDRILSSVGSWLGGAKGADGSPLKAELLPQ